MTLPRTTLAESYDVGLSKSPVLEVRHHLLGGRDWAWVGRVHELAIRNRADPLLAGASIHHPRVLDLIEVHPVGEQVLFIGEAPSGLSLAEALDSLRRLNAGVAGDLARQLLEVAIELAEAGFPALRLGAHHVWVSHGESPAGSALQICVAHPEAWAALDARAASQAGLAELLRRLAGVIEPAHVARRSLERAAERLGQPSESVAGACRAAMSRLAPTGPHGHATEHLAWADAGLAETRPVTPFPPPQRRVPHREIKRLRDAVLSQPDQPLDAAQVDGLSQQDRRHLQHWIDSARAQTLLAVARRHLDGGDLKASQQPLEAILELDPDHVVALALLAPPAEAEASLPRTRPVPTIDALRRSELGLPLQEPADAGDTDERLRRRQRATAHLDASRRLAEEGQHDKALLAATAALEADPGSQRAARRIAELTIDADRAIAEEVEAIRREARRHLAQAELRLETAIARHGRHERLRAVEEELRAQASEERGALVRKLVREARDCLRASRLDEAAIALRRLEALDASEEDRKEIEGLQKLFGEGRSAAQERRAVRESVEEIERLLAIQEVDAARQVHRTARQRFGDTAELQTASIALECVEGQVRRVEIEQLGLEVADHLENGRVAAAEAALAGAEADYGSDPEFARLRERLRAAQDAAAERLDPAESSVPSTSTVALLAEDSPDLASLESQLESAVGSGDLDGARSILDALSPELQMTLGSFKVRLDELEVNYRDRHVEMLIEKSRSHKENGELRAAVRSLREATALAPDDQDLATELHWLQTELRARRRDEVRAHKLGAEIVTIEDLWNRGRVRAALRHLDATASRLEAHDELEALRVQLLADPRPATRRRMLLLAAAVLVITVGLVAGLVRGWASTTPPHTALIVEARPWAEVTRVEASDGEPIELADDRSTPLRVQLAPGRYVVELRGPRGQTTEVEVDVPTEGTSVGVDFEVLDVDTLRDGVGAPESVADSAAPRGLAAPAN